MKTLQLAIVTIVFLVMGANWAGAGEQASPKVVAFAESVLLKYGTDPVLVDVVSEANAHAGTLEEIKAMDEKWQAHAGIADYMREMMESKAASYLRSIQKTAPYYSEIFLMNRLGANVAMTDKTSDYWQGDEAKFIKSFADGKGALFIDEVEFDKSSQAYLVQISVPIRSGENVIGAITFGINVDEMK